MLSHMLFMLALYATAFVSSGMNFFTKILLICQSIIRTIINHNAVHSIATEARLKRMERI